MKKILSVLLCFCLLFTGCEQTEHAENKKFTAFTDQLFINQMNSDALSANYTLAHPENWGVSQENPTLGSVSLDGLKASVAENENLSHALTKFQAEKLSFSQQVLYNTLDVSFRHAMKEQNFLLFHQYLGPTTGVQAQLPVLLAEFHLDKKENFDTYFSLLKSIPMYFQSITDYEALKSSDGKASAASTLSRIILQCRHFIEKPEKNILITNFNERLQEMTFLSNQEKKELRIKNRQLVTDIVLPAYSELIAALEKLLPLARPDGGLFQLKNGKAYYTYLFQASVGSLRSIPEARNMITSALSEARSELMALAKKNPELFGKTSLLSATTNTPKEILETLEQSIQKDFPATDKVNYQVRYVPDSLEDFLSPAFYLTPPMDDSTKNVIYINGATKYENTNLFPTLAHEGYPGHLFQSAYLHEHLFSPLQSTLNFGGYTEGWATYAEIYSYKYAGLENDIVRILQNNTVMSLCLYTLCDIGIHYDGWDLTATGKFLEKYGIHDITDVLSIYQSLIDEPAAYPKYCMGYLEILALQKKAKKLLGSRYSDKLFHTWFLDMGPTWFEVLDAYMEPWFEQNNH